MNATSKKPKTLSANSLTKLVSKNATRAQPAEKTSGTSKHICKGNSKHDAVPDQHNVVSDETVTAEGYIFFIFSYFIQNKAVLVNKLSAAIIFFKDCHNYVLYNHWYVHG